jgi:hypothetical protein
LPQAGSQVGAQAGSQAFTGQQGAGHAFSQAATLAQALQPPFSFMPSNRFRSSAPNPWLHRAALSKSAPKIVLLFIEQQLLYSELEKAGLPDRQPATLQTAQGVDLGSWGGFSHG